MHYTPKLLGLVTILQKRNKYPTTSVHCLAFHVISMQTVFFYYIKYPMAT